MIPCLFSFQVATDMLRLHDIEKKWDKYSLIISSYNLVGFTCLYSFLNKIIWVKINGDKNQLSNFTKLSQN